MGRKRSKKGKVQVEVGAERGGVSKSRTPQLSDGTIRSNNERISRSRKGETSPVPIVADFGLNLSNRSSREAGSGVNSRENGDRDSGEESSTRDPQIEGSENTDEGEMESETEQGPSWVDLVEGEDGNDEEQADRGETKMGQKKSQEVVAGNTQDKNCLPFYKVEIEEGGVVSFEEEDVKEAIEYWQHSLVGVVEGGNVSFTAMERFIGARWKAQLFPKIFLYKK